MSLKNRLSQLEATLDTSVPGLIIFFDNEIRVSDAEKYNLPLNISIKEVEELKEDHEIIHFLGGELYWKECT